MSLRDRAGQFTTAVRTELTDRMLVFGERHIRHLLNAYAQHYNRQRPHRSRQYAHRDRTARSRPNQPNWSPVELFSVVS